jgi:hypothetical protein
MLWQQNAYRENPFGGSAAYGWFRNLQLGQALRCWRTEDEGAVCSNLMYYSPNCPTTPPITETEILPAPPEAPGAS